MLQYHHITIARAVILSTIICATCRRFATALNPGSGVSLSRHGRHPNYFHSASIRCGQIRPLLAAAGASGLTNRIYDLVGREFDINKPSVLAKVIFDEVQVCEPKASEPTPESPKRIKSKSVSASSLSKVLKLEQDPRKRELLGLVLEWLDAKAVAKRGGFVACDAKVADMPGWSSRLIPDDDDLKTDPSAPPVLLIDGHYIIFRSFHGMPPLSAPDGTPVGALVGFCNVINKLVVKPWADGSQPRRKVVVALDTGKDNFRHTVFPGYKADRMEAPADLRPQFALIRRACEAYGLETAEGPGFEADDVIASLALEAVTAGASDVTIVSADKDLAQLVTRRVKMLNCYTDETLGPDEVLSKYLAPPGRLADLLAIAGDRADGIKGADGYGPVTAAKVLAKHATLEEAVDDICETMVKKKKEPALVEETRLEILLARRLVELCTSVPLGKTGGAKKLEDVQPFQLGEGAAAGRLLDFMREVGMQDLVRRTSTILGVNEDGT